MKNKLILLLVNNTSTNGKIEDDIIKIARTVTQSVVL